MKKSFAVLGVGSFGLKLIEELSQYQVDVIAIDSNDKNIEKASKFVDNAFVCDLTNEAALRELGVHHVDHAVVAFGDNLQNTILTTIILKEFGIPKITVRVDEDFFIPVLKKLGATDIFSPQKIAGVRLANKIISDSFVDFFKITNEYCVIEILVNKDVIPLKIQDTNSRNRFDINILMIQRGNNTFTPKGIDYIMADDLIYVFGTQNKISKFEHFINSQTE